VFIWVSNLKCKCRHLGWDLIFSTSNFNTKYDCHRGEFFLFHACSLPKLCCVRVCRLCYLILATTAMGWYIHLSLVWNLSSKILYPFSDQAGFCFGDRCMIGGNKAGGGIEHSCFSRTGCSMGIWSSIHFDHFEIWQTVRFYHRSLFKEEKCYKKVVFNSCDWCFFVC
jgi:hypothetical protein